MNKKTLLSILIAFMLCFTTVMPAATASVFATDNTAASTNTAPAAQSDQTRNGATPTANNAIVGEKKCIFEKDEFLDNDDYWSYSLTTDVPCNLYFNVATIEVLDADFYIEVGNYDTDDITYYTYGYVDEYSRFDDYVTLNPGTYQIRFYNDDYYDIMHYNFKVYYELLYTVEYPLYSISPDSVDIYLGETAVLNAQAQPSPATYETVSWSIANPEIATIDENGVVTGISSGKTIVTANIDGNICTATVNIKNPDYTINASSVSLYKKETKQLKLTVTPASFGLDGLTWSSSNTAVATVSSTGLVTAKAKGTATISAKINGTTVKSCTVTVNNPTYAINASSVSLYKKGTKQLKVTVTPSSYGLSGLKWSSSNKKVATVNSKGLVTAKAKGTATISAKINGTTVKSCTVTVKNPVYKINAAKLSLYPKYTKKLKITVTPSSYGLSGLKWSSSNKKVATVNSKGIVTAQSKGTATIYAKVNGTVVKKCVVTVKPMKLNKTATTIYVKKAKKLIVTGGSGKIRWKSSNKKVATVSSTGVVKGIKPGTAYISAKRNGKTVKCKVVVKWQPETGVVKSTRYNYPSGKCGNVKTVTFAGKTTIAITGTNRSDPDDWWNSESLYITIDKVDPDDTYTYASKFIDAGTTRTFRCTVPAGKYSIYADCSDSFSIKMTTTTKPQINKKSTTIAKGYKEALKISGVKNGGTWSSSNKNIATVTSKGVVKGKKKGSCYIKYKLKTGVVLKCKVTVSNPVTCKVTGVDDTGIFNECDVKFTNYTNKKVTYIKLNISQYDNRWKRVSKNSYDYSWFYVNDNLPAKSSDTWEFWVNDNAIHCKAYITKVYFSDGTTWTP